MVNKRKLLIIYDWFYPGFMAGGPIQSLTNLAISLIPEFDVFIITASSDLNSVKNYDNAVINCWNSVLLPQTSEPVKVYYAASRKMSIHTFRQLFADVVPDTVYLNGLFSYRYFLLPLFSLTRIKISAKLVVCPRGMLKKGALSGKPLKKKVYLRLLKWSRLLNNALWHATTHEEAEDIASHFPVNNGILVASNIPKSPFKQFSILSKSPGTIKIVYLSLINEHKNLLFLLQLMKQLDAAISLDIYGPVIDESYWKRCQDLVKEMAGNIRYKGLVQPEQVQEVLSRYHALVLFTKGENFGHAIYESLSVGRPVITSCFTPWQNLWSKKAGANADINNFDDCLRIMKVFSGMNQSVYDEFCASSLSEAGHYYAYLDAVPGYRKLFS